MPNTVNQFHGQVIKIYEDTSVGQYALEVHNAVGASTVVGVARRYTEAQLPQFKADLAAMLKGLLS